MSTKTRAEIFEEHLPTLTEKDIEQLGSGVTVLSFETLPLLTEPSEAGFLAIRFALGDGAQATVLMDRFACNLLRAVVDLLNSADWKVSQVPPDGSKLN